METLGNIQETAQESVMPRGFFNLTPAQVAAISNVFFEQDREVTTRDLAPYYRKQLGKRDDACRCAVCDLSYPPYDGRVQGCVVVCHKCDMEIRKYLPTGFRSHLFRMIYGECVKKYRAERSAEEAKSVRNQQLARDTLQTFKPLSPDAFKAQISRLSMRNVQNTLQSSESSDVSSLFDDVEPASRDASLRPVASDAVEFIPDADEDVTRICSDDVSDWRSEDFKRHYFDIMHHRKNLKTRLGNTLFYTHPILQRYQDAFDRVLELWGARFPEECAEFKAQSEAIRAERKLLSRLEDIQSRAHSTDVSVGVTEEERTFLDENKEKFIALRAKYSGKKRFISDDEQALKDNEAKRQEARFVELRREYMAHPDSLSPEDREFVESKMRKETERQMRVRKKHESATMMRAARKNSGDRKKGGRKKK